jgi:hypothetical protein
MNIESLLKNPSEFSMYIEREAKKSNTTLFDMLLSSCEKYNIEIDSVKKLISKSLEEKMYQEALTMNLLTEKKVVSPLMKFL